MICLCKFPLESQEFHNLEICSCPICHGVIHYLWYILWDKPTIPPSPCEDLQQAFQDFSEELCRWIQNVIELEGPIPEILPLLHRKITTFQQQHLGYLDLLLYPTEQFAYVDKLFTKMQESLRQRIIALENKLVTLIRQTTKEELAVALQQVAFWSPRDYAVQLASVWQEATSLLQEDN